MEKNQIKAYLFGIISFAILFAIREAYSHFFLSIQEDSGLDYFARIFTILVLITPGYITGWFSQQKATVDGFVVSLFCHTASFLLFSIQWSNFSFNYLVLNIWLGTAILPSAVGAVSGAAGKLHNKYRTL